MEDVTKELLADLDPGIPPQVDYPDQPKKVIRLARAFRDQGESILTLSRNRWYVEESANLLDLADDLTEYPNIQAVGVVAGRSLRGIVVRKDLFDLLGRPFGRDVLQNETVARVCQQAPSFIHSTNIFSVGETLGTLQRSAEIRYYPLRTERDEFVGIFNSQDLLYFFSDLTRKDINLARSIQNRIVRESSHHDSPALEIVCSSTMAKGVGGDFYYYNNYSDQRWIFCVCDVSGKGVAASMVTCALWGAVSGFDMRYGMGKLVRHLNSFMIHTFEQEKFATGVFMDYQEDTRQLTMADLGHGYAYLYRHGKLMRIKASADAWPLGISADIDVALYRYTLEPDDIVLLLTDGMVEQPGRDDAHFGIQPIRRILDAHASESLSRIRLRLLEDFHAFRGNTPLCDDLTFLMFRPHKASGQ